MIFYSFTLAISFVYLFFPFDTSFFNNDIMCKKILDEKFKCGHLNQLFSIQLIQLVGPHDGQFYVLFHIMHNIN